MQKKRKEMLEDDGRKMAFESKEAIDSMKEQLRRLIMERRRIPEGEYHEKVTSEYELTLEYHFKTILISLHTVKGKNYRLIVCDEGQHRLENGLTTQYIFRTIKDYPEKCQVYPDDSLLILETQHKINLKRVELSRIEKLRIQFCWFLQKCIRKETEANQINENIKELKKEDKIRHQNLVDKTTPFAKCYTIKHNTITRSDNDNKLRMVMVDAVAKEGVLRFSVSLDSMQGGLYIGMTDRVTQKTKPWAQPEHSIQYRSMGDICYADGNGEYSRVKAVQLQEQMKMVVEVEREKGKVTFQVAGQNFVAHSRILSHPQRQFVPCFQMMKVGDSITWELQ